MGMGHYPGELEQMILAAVLRRGNRAYGVEILEEISAGTGRRVGSGALSVALDRLEAKGLIVTAAADPDQGRGGRPRRYAMVTEEGVVVIREVRAAMLALWDGLDGVLGH
jgi:DNA-binding PadR family transcriptional regulator